jgi:anti-sigma B factor antagonist
MMTHSHRQLLDVEQVGDVPVARLAGDGFWEDETVRSLRGPLQGLLERPGSPGLVLDLAPLDHLSSSAIGLIVGLHRRARAAGRRVALCAVTPRARAVLERIHLAGVLEVYPAAEQALASFAAGGPR